MVTRFTAFSDDHMSKGNLIAVYKKAINSEDFVHFFEDHGFATVDCEQWYKTQDLLDVFNDMQTASAGLFDFVSLGMVMGENFAIPPQVDQHAPEQMLGLLSVIQSTTAQTSNPGYVKIERLADNHYLVRARVTMPDNVLYGMLYAFAKRFVPASQHVLVAFPTNGERHDEGAEFTMLDLSWK